MNKNILALVVVVILAISGFVFVNQKRFEKPKNTITQTVIPVKPPIEKAKGVDYKASFAIFTHGTFRVFTAAMYHNQSEDVYIQADNPNIVHVKKSGETWDDFFKTLPFKLTKNCLTTGTGETFCSNANGKLRFYLNGRGDTNALDIQIKNGDSLLVTYGDENDQQIQNQLRKSLLK